MPPALGVTLKILAVAGVMLLIYYLRNVLLPFAFAFFMAYMLNPIVNWFQKYTRHRWIAVVVTLLLSLVAVVGALWLILPFVFGEFRHLYTLVSEQGLASEWRDMIPAFVNDYISNILSDKSIDEIIKNDNVSQALQGIAKVVLPRIASFLGQTYDVIASVLGCAIVILYLIFIMLDYEAMSSGFYRLFPQKYKDRFQKFFQRFTAETQKYIRGQALVALTVAVLYAIGFKVVGLPMGIVLGLLVGVLNLVPYLQILGFLPAFCLALVKSIETGNPLWLVILQVAAVFVVVQILQDMFITPRIMGKTTGLNPAMILLSLSIWGKLLGFLGLLLAIPFSCLVKIYYQEYMSKIDGESQPQIPEK